MCVCVCVRVRVRRRCPCVCVRGCVNRLKRRKTCTMGLLALFAVRFQFQYFTTARGSSPFMSLLPTKLLMNWEDITADHRDVPASTVELLNFWSC